MTTMSKNQSDGVKPGAARPHRPRVHLLVVKKKDLLRPMLSFGDLLLTFPPDFFWKANEASRTTGTILHLVRPGIL
jgi:hypothetical protein